MLLTNSLNRIAWKIVLCSHQRLEQFIFCINKTVRIHEGEFLSTGHNEKLFLTVLMIFFHSVYFCLYEAKVGFGNTESNQDLKFWHKQMNSRVVNVKWYHLVLEIPVSSSTWGLLQCRCGRDTSLPELLQFLGLQCQKKITGKLWLSGQLLKPLKVLCVENWFPCMYRILWNNYLNKTQK